MDLKINLTVQEEVFFILKNLPFLEYLNGKTTKEDNVIDVDEKEIDSIDLKDDIDNFNVSILNC